MKKEGLLYGFWVRAYTTSLRGETATTFLGQVAGFGRLTTAQGGIETVWLKNSHGAMEVPLDHVIKHVEFWPPVGGETVCVIVNDAPDFPTEFTANVSWRDWKRQRDTEHRLYVRPENREVLESIAAVWNSYHNPAPEYPWYVKEVVLLPPEVAKVKNQDHFL
jgi:hypothetical protein